MNAPTKRVLVKVLSVIKIWKIRNKKIIHKPKNRGQTMTHNRTCVTLQETRNEIKLIGEEIEISEIDCRNCNIPYMIGTATCIRVWNIHTLELGY